MTARLSQPKYMPTDNQTRPDKPHKYYIKSRILHCKTRLDIAVKTTFTYLIDGF